MNPAFLGNGAFSVDAGFINLKSEAYA